MIQIKEKKKKKKHQTYLTININTPRKKISEDQLGFVKDNKSESSEIDPGIDLEDLTAVLSEAIADSQSAGVSKKSKKTQRSKSSS